MRGYKIFNKNMLPKGYTNDNYFSTDLEDAFKVCNDTTDRIFVIQTSGDVVNNERTKESIAEKVELIRELNKDEVEEILNHRINNEYEYLFRENMFGLINYGLFLDKFVKDDDRDIRIQVAKKGYGLDELIDDDDWGVRLAVAEQGYGLDKLIEDDCVFVRQAVAKQGYRLGELINDNDYIVRVEVAKKGYGLNKLLNDENWIVKRVAMVQLNKTN